jgi:hypothetical protein
MNALAATLALFITLPASGRDNGVTGGPQGIYPYLFKSYSKKEILQAPRNDPRHPWKILHQGRIDSTKVLIKALRVEFKPDSSDLTTGDGLFGISRTATRSKTDKDELRYYSKDTVYAYDALPHDYDYFGHQLQFVRDYFRTVSRGAVAIDYEVYPRRTGYDAYTVPEQMPKYSPGAKKPEESYDEYYYRRTKGLMQFIRDAIVAADMPAITEYESPFANVTVDSSRGSHIFIDTATHQRVIFLLIHAGASYLTDAFANSPSDMIDAFISTDFFSFFCDTIKDIACVDNKKRAGVWVNGANAKILIDEIMMVSETSNQDSLNWGIHGILVNQVARQLGIPDLYSTMSGVSAVGAFCIMDFAGYSAANGFIPPWPSAWVRSFMGWDLPVVTDIESRSTFQVKAISASQPGDTTILLVPINDHEYYLIENRQRNLSGDASCFNYDTTDKIVYLDRFNPVNLQKNVLSTLGARSKVIDRVRSFDAGIPASGVLVWHVDENQVRDRLTWNVLNADSLYRAVNLVEADGISDLGVTFQNALYQSVYDYGGAEDVFPHTTNLKPGVDRSGTPGTDTTIASFGPFTRPASKSNDGGHTYLNLSFAPVGKSPAGGLAAEVTQVREVYYVSNWVDSAFTVTVTRDTKMPGISGWPRRLAPGRFFDPAACDLFTNKDTLEIAALDKEGRLYVMPAAGSSAPFAKRPHRILNLTLAGDTARSADSALLYDTIFFFDSIPAPAAMPTVIGKTLYIPSRDSSIHVLTSIGSAPSYTAVWDTIALTAAASSYVCNWSATQWAVGLSNGSIAFGAGATVSGYLAPPDSAKNSPVTALALINSTDSTLAAVHANGTLTAVTPQRVIHDARLGGELYPPFSLATADLNRLDDDPAPNIVVSDSRQGVWLYTFHSRLDTAAGWSNRPVDWAGASYSFSEDTTDTSRARFAMNGSSPSLADIDGNGTLEILIAGTNGIYALTANGTLLDNTWPAFLDNRYWYQRGVVTNTPVVATTTNKMPLVLFAAPTGQNVTFTIAHIDTALPQKGKLFYFRVNAEGDTLTDSITGLTTGFIDSLIIFGDSLILPYVTPGGFVDALDRNGKRPGFISTLYNVGKERQSYWPLTTGGTPSTAPMLCDPDANGNTDIITITESGWCYRWELGPELLSNAPIWPQVGYNGSRTFAYGGAAPTGAYAAVPAIKEFYTFPNPARGISDAVVRWNLTAPAVNTRLDIYTFTGYHVFSAENLPHAYGINEISLSLRQLGPAVYSCRLESTFPNNKKSVKYWKMAVVNK